MGSLKFLLCLSVYVGLLSSVGYLVNSRVPEPYMDEIFHIPQAQLYCSGNFTYWDPKITTLPGLYLFSVGVLKPVASLSQLVSPQPWSLEDSCSTVHLRAVNVICGITNLLLIFGITVQLHGEKQDFQPGLAVWSSLNMALLPVLFMFNFLYYTDAISTTMVLLTYSLHLYDRNVLAALAGACSVMCRQTNIVWVFLVAALTGGNTLLAELRLHQTRTKQPPTIALTTLGQVKELGLATVSLMQSPWRAARTLGLVVVSCAGYLIVGLSFVLFVRWNGGIVVGDRTAHQAALHLPQLLYFSLFFGGLCAPFIAGYLGDFLLAVRAHRRLAAGASLAMAAAIYLNTVAHPYLLADNRHLTFYLWRRFFARHWAAKYLPLPAYLFAHYSLGRILNRSELVFRLVFPACLVLSLVAQQLLELRYFILPFLLARLQIKPASLPLRLAAESLLVAGINAGVFYLFLWRPFTWDSEPGRLQRFMW